MNYISPNHRHEWQQSAVLDELINLNVESAKPGYEAFELLFYSERLPRLNTGILPSWILKKYRHLEDGGWWCNGLDPLANWEPMQWGRFKPNTQRLDTTKGNGKVVKYESPPKEPGRVTYFRVTINVWARISLKYNVAPPENIFVTSDGEALGFWAWVMEHPEIPIILTEGEKKALCWLSQGLVAIGVPGIWMGTRRISNSLFMLHPDLVPMASKGRKFIISFDYESNPATRKQINQATLRLGQAIEDAGAICEVATLPGPEKGIDDWVMALGEKAEEAVTTLVVDAVSLKDYRKSQFVNHYRGLHKYTPDLVVNCKYLSNKVQLPSSGLVCLSSDMGTGKTELMRQWRQANPDKRFLNNGHRVNLLKNLSTRLETQLYSELMAGTLSSTTALSITVDSLYKLNEQVEKYGCIFIDEACQFLAHLLQSKTCKDNQAEIMDVLEYLVFNAPLVVLADAHLDDVTVDFFRAMRPESEKPFIIKNDYKSGGRNIFWYSSPKSSGLVASICAAVLAGQKIMVVSDSKKFIKKVERLLNNKYGESLSSDDIEENHNQDTEGVKNLEVREAGKLQEYEKWENCISQPVFGLTSESYFQFVPIPNSEGINNKEVREAGKLQEYEKRGNCISQPVFGLTSESYFQFVPIPNSEGINNKEVCEAGKVLDFWSNPVFGLTSESYFQFVPIPNSEGINNKEVCEAGKLQKYAKRVNYWNNPVFGLTSESYFQFVPIPNSEGVNNKGLREAGKLLDYAKWVNYWNNPVFGLTSESYFQFVPIPNSEGVNNKEVCETGKLLDFWSQPVFGLTSESYFQFVPIPNSEGVNNKEVCEAGKLQKYAKRVNYWNNPVFGLTSESHFQFVPIPNSEGVNNKEVCEAGKLLDYAKWVNYISQPVFGLTSESHFQFVPIPNSEGINNKGVREAGKLREFWSQPVLGETSGTHFETVLPPNSKKVNRKGKKKFKIKQFSTETSGTDSKITQLENSGFLPSKLRIWTIHSENSGSEENVKFIKNIRQAVKRVDALLASPSLGTGVDIPDYHFDAIFGAFHAVTQTATECAQMLWRYRPNVPTHVWVAPRPPFGFKSINASKIKQDLLDSNRMTAFLIKRDRVTGERGAEKDWALDAYCRLEAQRNFSINNLQADLKSLLEEMGNRIIPVADSVSEITALEMRNAGIQIDEAYCLGVANAQLIDKREYLSRQSQDYLNPEQIYEFEKFRILDAYGMIVTPELVKRDDGGKLISQLVALEEILANAEGMITDDIRNFSCPLPPALVQEKDNQERDMLPMCFHWRNRSCAWLGRFRLGLPEIITQLQNGLEVRGDELILQEMRDLAVKAAPQVKAILGVTIPADKSAIWILSLLLGQLGLKLTSRKIGARGKQVRYYHLEEESLAFAIQVLERRKQQRIEKERIRLEAQQRIAWRIAWIESLGNSSKGMSKSVDSDDKANSSCSSISVSTPNATTASPASVTPPSPASGTAPSPTSGTAPSPASVTPPSPTSGTAPSPTSGTAPSPTSGTAPSTDESQATSGNPSCFQPVSTPPHKIGKTNFLGGVDTRNSMSKNAQFCWDFLAMLEVGASLFNSADELVEYFGEAEKRGELCESELPEDYWTIVVRLFGDVADVLESGYSGG